MRSRLTKSMPAGPTRTRILLTALVALAAAPGVAVAATVEVGPEGVLYQALPGEVNDVTMRDAGPVAPRRSVVEASAPLTLGPGCDAGTPILCSDLSHRIDVLRLGDRNDRANYFSNFADSYVYGEQGNDDVVSAGSTAYGYGGAGNDRVGVSSNGPSYGWGGPGNDVVEGGGVADVLRGGRGNDVIRSRGSSPGNLFGGPGNDRLEATDGHGLSSAQGGTGNDTLLVFPANGADREFRGGPGNDLISVAGSQFALDRILAGPGNDRALVVNGHADSVDCGAGRDSVEADKFDTAARNCERVTITTVEPPQ